jgi:hypothetical protein
MEQIDYVKLSQLYTDKLNSFTKEDLLKYIEIDNSIKRDVHPIEFGRWILKYCNAVFDGDSLCWSHNWDDDRIYYNTDELYELFLNKTR